MSRSATDDVVERLERVSLSAKPQSTTGVGVFGIGTMSRSSVISERRERRYALIQDLSASTVYSMVITGDKKGRHPKDVWTIRELESNVMHQLNLLAVTHQETCRLILAIEKQISMSMTHLTATVSVDSAIAQYIRDRPNSPRASASKYYPTLNETDVSQQIIRLLHIMALVTI
jgi:hypothetical protein